MREFSFTAEWGEWTLYFADEYHCSYDFSGRIEVDNGSVVRLEKITFPGDIEGPYVYAQQYTAAEGSSWEQTVKRWFGGMRFTIRAEDDSEIRLVTKAASVSFRYSELLKEGHLVFHAGGHYSMALIVIETGEHDWFTAPVREGEIRISGKEFSGAQREFYGISGSIAAPASEVCSSFRYAAPEAGTGEGVLSIHAAVRFLISKSPEKEEPATGVPDFAIRINGQEVYRNARFTAAHDRNSQFLEEVPFRIDPCVLREGENRIAIRNRDERFSLLIPMVRIFPGVTRHMQVISCPAWVVVGKIFHIAIVSTQKAAKLRIRYDPSLFEAAMEGEEAYPGQVRDLEKLNPIRDGENVITEGRHVFFFRARRVQQNGKICFTDIWSGESGEAVIGESWSGACCENAARIGVEIKTGNPQDYLSQVRRISEEQMGNLAVFRDYHNRCAGPERLWEAAAACRKYDIYVAALLEKEQGVLANAAAEHFQGAGDHESSGFFYFADDREMRRKKQRRGYSMKDAQHLSRARLRAIAKACRIPGQKTLTCDASGGTREAFLSGFGLLCHETFVAHHLLVLPNARGCAKAFGQPFWGVHIASQHNIQPELEDGIRRFWLAFAYAWIFGAGYIYEEDSLFQCFKYRRMVEDDSLPASKRRINAEFFKRSQTHPRQGVPAVPVAILQGRYAPPFNGISTASSGTAQRENEDFPVWGKYGRYSRTWGFRQPEKGYHLLEILAPGICLNPLHQDPSRVRRLFSGDPLGEFDFLPTEAPSEVFSGYQVILLLAWNTMGEGSRQDPEGDAGKLYRFVSSGGTLFLSIPQLTRSADREILDHPDSSLPLIGDDEIGRLCGVSVRGRSETVFSGAAGLKEFADTDFGFSKVLIRQPNRDEMEDGSCYLADVVLQNAEAVVKDSVSGKPLIVRCPVGKGWTYLLCAYAFPGHEALKYVLPPFLRKMLRMHIRRNACVRNGSGDIYWSDWVQPEKGENIEEKCGHSEGRLYLLNTDWTKADNFHRAEICIGDMRFWYRVYEGRIAEIVYCGKAAFAVSSRNVSITREKRGQYLISGFEDTVLQIWTAEECVIRLDDRKITVKTDADGKTVTRRIPLSLGHFGDCTARLTF